MHDGDRDNVIGCCSPRICAPADRPSFDLRAWLRPVVFIPESKRLNVLLREFRVSRNHMAIVVDEFGGVAGLVTIEDVLEQIVGDIEDEYDFDETEDNIRLDKSGRYRVKARTEVADFNAAFGCSLSEEDADTIGGLILSQLGRVPKRNESIDLGGLRLRVLRADSRRLYTLLVEPLPPGAAPEPVCEAIRGKPPDFTGGAGAWRCRCRRLCAACLVSAGLAGRRRAYLLLAGNLAGAGLMLGFAFGLGYFLTGTSWSPYVSMSVSADASCPCRAGYRALLYLSGALSCACRYALS